MKFSFLITYLINERRDARLLFMGRTTKFVNSQIKVWEIKSSKVYYLSDPSAFFESQAAQNMVYATSNWRCC
jgi:hypothetical protein